MFDISFLKSKLSQDLLWNYASFVLLAISGVLINLIIAYFYGAASLGRFNLVYTVYILLSQFSVGGIHYSALVHLAKYVTNIERARVIIGSALLPTVLLSLLFALLLYFSSKVVAGYIGGQSIATGLILIAPALLFFSINKVLLASLNGLQYMKVYAFAQGLRYILMFIFILYICLGRYNEMWLSANFLFAELILTIFLATFTLLILKGKVLTNLRWLKIHIEFGIKGFLTGVFVEMNSRVDILILGHFVSNQSVGVYSFVAMMAEGIYQLLVVVRTILNPFLVKYLTEDSFHNLRSLIIQTRKIVYPIFIVIAVCALLVYPIFIDIFLPGRGFAEGWLVLAILLAGIVIASGFIPFDTILANAGYPGQQTFQAGLVVITNALINFLLVPSFGIVGSAIATMIASYVFSILYLNYLTKRNLMFNIILPNMIYKQVQIGH